MIVALDRMVRSQTTRWHREMAGCRRSTQNPDALDAVFNTTKRTKGYAIGSPARALVLFPTTHNHRTLAVRFSPVDPRVIIAFHRASCRTVSRDGDGSRRRAAGSVVIECASVPRVMSMEVTANRITEGRRHAHARGDQGNDRASLLPSRAVVSRSHELLMCEGRASRLGGC